MFVASPRAAVGPDDGGCDLRGGPPPSATTMSLLPTKYPSASVRGDQMASTHSRSLEPPGLRRAQPPRTPIERLIREAVASDERHLLTIRGEDATRYERGRLRRVGVEPGG